MACRSFRPGQELANRFEFWGKKIRIPTRGWARTASPERADKRGCPDCRRPTSTLGSNIIIQSAGRPETRADILDAKRINKTITHYWPAGRSDPGKSSQTGLNSGERRSESQQEVGHVRRARSGQTKEVVQTAVGQPRRSAEKDIRKIAEAYSPERFTS